MVSKLLSDEHGFRQFDSIHSSQGMRQLSEAGDFFYKPMLELAAGVAGCRPAL